MYFPNFLIQNLPFPDSPRRFVIFHWIVWLSSFTGIFMVLLSRGHYTVDVVIGYYVTTRVFWIYHTMANNAALKVGIYLLHLQIKFSFVISVYDHYLFFPPIFLFSFSNYFPTLICVCNI